MADRYLMTGGGSVNWNSTASWSATSGGATGVSFPVAGDNVFMDANSGAGTLTVNVSSACLSLNATGYTGSLAGSGALAIGGSRTWGAGMTLTYTGTITHNSTVSGNTLTSNGRTGSHNTTFAGVGGVWTFTDAQSITGTYTLTNGSLIDAGFNLTCSLFSSANSNVRSITKTGTWTLTGTGTVFNLSTITNLTYSDTAGDYILSNASASARTFNAASNLGTINSLKVTAGTGDFTIAGGNTYANIDFTGYTGAWQAGSNISFSGPLIIGAGMTVPDAAITYTATGTANQVFTANGVTFNRGITINKASGKLSPAGALNLGNRILTLTSGEFDTNNQAVSINSFSSSNSNVRALTLGSSTVTLMGTGTIWNTNTPTNLTFTPGTSTVYISDTSAVTKTFTGAATLNNLTFEGGSGVLAFAISGLKVINRLQINTAPATIQLRNDTVGRPVINQFVHAGNAGNLTSFTSSVPGSTAALEYAGSGFVDTDYMNVKDFDGYSGVWFFGENSTNSGNNIGAAFKSAKNVPLGGCSC